jgi:GT2 family glycosyltransferase
MPEVTVLMPVRDGERFLAEAIDSILAQSLADLELIVVDDGSTDGSAGIIRRRAAADARVRSIAADGRGIAAALRLGLEAASGGLVARMDADDVALPDRLAAQRDYLETHPGVVAVGGQVEKIDSSGSSIGRGHYPVGPNACRAHLRRGSPLCHPAVTMRTDALVRCGGYRDRHGAAEDYDLWLRLAAEGDIDNLGRAVLRYRIHGENITLRKASENARDAALAHLEAFHASLETIPAAPAGEDWATVEARLPERLRGAGRLAYLRALALNGGITDPAACAFLLDSLGALRAEARRLGAGRDLAFTLLRAARQFARARQFATGARLAVLGCAASPGEAARTVATLLKRGA